MRPGLLHILLLVLLTAVPAAFADTSDVIGASGSFANETGMKGAIANRQMADKLYQQALADEKAAWAGFPPNVGLLSKALTESKNGKAADDQAKEFARAALHGANSASQAGDLASSKYSNVDVAKLKDLATNNSPFTGQVQSRLGGYGMKLDPDKMVLQTPLGKFPIGMADDKLESTMRGVASLLGYNPNDVSKGFQAAIKTREELARAVEAGAGLGGAQKTAGGTPGAGASGTDGMKPDDKNAANGANGAAGGAAAAAAFGDEGPSGAEKTDAIEANRRAYLARLGFVNNGDAQDVRADKNADIFMVVHMHYQSLRADGGFIESEKIPSLAAGPAPGLGIHPASRTPANVATAPPSR